MSAAGHSLTQSVGRPIGRPVVCVPRGEKIAHSQCQLMTQILRKALCITEQVYLGCFEGLLFILLYRRPIIRYQLCYYLPHRSAVRSVHMYCVRQTTCLSLPSRGHGHLRDPFHPKSDVDCLGTPLIKLSNPLCHGGWPRLQL